MRPPRAGEPEGKCGAHVVQARPQLALVDRGVGTPGGDPNAAFVVGQDRIYAVEMFRIFGKVLDFAAALSGSGDVRRGGRLQRGRYLFTVRQLGLQTTARRWRR